MKICKNCGVELDDNFVVCPHCGVACEMAPAEENTASVPNKLNVGQLVWSIINLAVCCTPLGIASLILTILAKDAEPEKSRSHLKIAKILNLIGTIGGALIYIAYIVFTVIMVILGMSMPMA